MANLQFELPDAIHQRLNVLAEEAGFGCVEQYARELLVRASTDETASVQSEIDSLLAKRLQTPDAGIEWTPEFREQLRLDIAKRRTAGSRT